MTEWKQERPTWCKHNDCVFARRTMDSACAGNLPKPVPHAGDMNIYRICIREILPNNEICDIQMNKTDLGWLRWLFDALDGKKTSWLSEAKVPDDEAP